jgi:uncharacterized protein YhfF
MRALVLTRDHRVLLDEQGLLPTLQDPEQHERPLEGLLELLKSKFGIKFSGWQDQPVGRSAQGWAWIIDTTLESAQPLADVAAINDDAWRMYIDCVLAGWEPPTRALNVFTFGADLELAAVMTHLIVHGQKRATATWGRLLEVQGKRPRIPGTVSIITDGFGLPQAAVETTDNDAFPFRDVPQHMIAREAEMDDSVDGWRDGHLRFYHGEALRLGLEFSEDETITFETFKVLARFTTGA